MYHIIQTTHLCLNKGNLSLKHQFQNIQKLFGQDLKTGSCQGKLWAWPLNKKMCLLAKEFKILAWLPYLGQWYSISFPQTFQNDYTRSRNVVVEGIPVWNGEMLQAPDTTPKVTWIQTIAEITNQTCNLDKNYSSFFSLEIFRPSFSWHIENFLGFFLLWRISLSNRKNCSMFFLPTSFFCWFGGGVFIWF